MASRLALVEQLQIELKQRGYRYRPVETFSEFTSDIFPSLLTIILDLYVEGKKPLGVGGDFCLFYVSQLYICDRAYLGQNKHSGVKCLQTLAQKGCLFSLEILIEYHIRDNLWTEARQYQTMAAKYGHLPSRHALAIYYAQHPSWAGAEFARQYGFTSLEKTIIDSFARLEEEEKRFLLMTPASLLSKPNQEKRGQLLTSLHQMLRQEQTYFHYNCVPDITRLIFQYVE